MWISTQISPYFKNTTLIFKNPSFFWKNIKRCSLSSFRDVLRYTFLIKIPSFQNLKVAIYKGFVISGR
ncbi:hypothetical protein CVT91_12440 [Candidatus Atribacteria bacterium HGW-Atribacteria-1]|nr:MAG: hypothetical protein CVT91_12440 [Candidatus Atribacteria bacterium HGW-Atribacteria-1]